MYYIETKREKFRENNKQKRIKKIGFRSSLAKCGFSLS